MSFDVTAFKNDPITYLGTRTLVNPGTTAASLTQADITGRTHLGGVGMELITVNNQLSRRDIVVSDTPHGFSLSLAASGQGAGAFKAYWLPWKSGEAYRIQLGTELDMFITAKMNSCGFIVGGRDRKQPVAIHANEANVTMPDYSSPNSPAYLKEIRGVQNNEYKLSYGGLAAQAIAAGLFGPSDPKVDQNVGVLDPEFYMTDKLQFASVFGIRSGEGWTFYANITDITNKGTTLELWPDQPKRLL
jgi:hypothetical protein